MREWPETFREADDWIGIEQMVLTDAGVRFVQQHTLDLQYLTADLHLIAILNDASDAVDAALSKGHPTPLTPMRNRLEKYGINDRVAAADEVRGEIALTRYIDNYLAYLSELLLEVFIARPEILRSGEQLRFEEALSHASMDDLIAYIADRKVASLSFQGLRDLTRYFETALGLELVQDAVLRVLMSEWVALRNLVIHRRGVVDQRAHNEGLPSADYSLGERIQVGRDAGFRLIPGVVSAVLDLDARTAAKFNLSVGPVPAPDSFEDTEDAEEQSDSR